MSATSDLLAYQGTSCDVDWFCRQSADVGRARRRLDQLRENRRIMLDLAEELRASAATHRWATLGANTAIAISASCDLILSVVASLPGVGASAQLVEIGARNAKLIATATTGQFTEKDAWWLLGDSASRITSLSLEVLGKQGFGKLVGGLTSLAQFADSLSAIQSEASGSAGIRGAAVRAAELIESIEREIWQLEGELGACGA